MTDWQKAKRQARAIKGRKYKKAAILTLLKHLKKNVITFNPL